MWCSVCIYLLLTACAYYTSAELKEASDYYNTIIHSFWRAPVNLTQTQNSFGLKFTQEVKKDELIYEFPLSSAYTPFENFTGKYDFALAVVTHRAFKLVAEKERTMSLYMLTMRILFETKNKSLPIFVNNFVKFHRENNDEMLLWNYEELQYLNNVSQQYTMFISPIAYFEHFKAFFKNSTYLRLFDDFELYMQIVHAVQYYSYPIILEEWKLAKNLPNVTDNNTKIFTNDSPVYAIIPGLDLVHHIQPVDEETAIPNYVTVKNGSLFHFAGKHFNKGDYYGYTRLADCSSPYLALYYGELVPNNKFDSLTVSMKNSTHNFSSDLFTICGKFNCMGEPSTNDTLRFKIKENEIHSMKLMSYIRIMNLHTFGREINLTHALLNFNKTRYFDLDNELFSERTYSYILRRNIKGMLKNDVDALSVSLSRRQTLALEYAINQKRILYHHVLAANKMEFVRHMQAIDLNLVGLYNATL